MKKILLIGLMVGIIGVPFCFADAKPVLEPNGITLEAANNVFVLGLLDGTKVLFYGDYGAGKDLWAERVDVDGNNLWSRSICAAANSQRAPWACETSDGKIIVAWEDERFGVTREDIFAAKIQQSDGTDIWTTQVTSVSATVREPRVCADSKGGAYITFSQGGMGDYLIAQHLRYDVGSSWQTDVPIDLYITSQPYDLISAPHNQAVVMYSSEEAVKGVGVRLKLITSESTGDEDSDGRVVQFRQRVGSYGDVVRNGDYINLAYMQDLGGGGGDDIFISKYDDYLTYVGTAILTHDSADQRYPRVIKDGAGNAYVCWADFRSYSQGNDLDIYIQKIKNMDNVNKGVIEWPADGILVTHAPQGVKKYFRVVGLNPLALNIVRHPMAYNNGRVYVVWHDYRLQPTIAWDSFVTEEEFISTHKPDIFAQSINSSSGDTLPNDIPICSLSTPEVFALVSTSNPFVTFLDFRSRSSSIMAQKLEEGDTIITNIITAPAGANMRVAGNSFGTDPSFYANSDFTINTPYNNVTFNGTTISATAWVEDEVTVNLTYDALLPGSYDIVLTAYGDVSNTFNLIKPSGTIDIQDVKFDGVPYSAEMAVKSSTTLTGQVISQYDIESSSITIDGVKSDLARDANNKFSRSISGLSVGPHSIVIEATDIFENSTEFPLNVSVSSAISFDEIYFGDRQYGGTPDFPEPAQLSDILKVKVESDYSLSEFQIGSSGVEINVMSYYSAPYLNVPLQDIGNFSGPSELVLRAKDENENEVSKPIYFEIPTKQKAEIKSAASQDVTGDSDGKIGFYYFPPKTVPGASATAAATSRVRIILYSPAGRPLSLEQNVSIGYNEVTLPRGMFDSNGLYIVKIYDEKNQHLATTRVLVYLGK